MVIRIITLYKWAIWNKSQNYKNGFVNLNTYIASIGLRSTYGFFGLSQIMYYIENTRYYSFLLL